MLRVSFVCLLLSLPVTARAATFTLAGAVSHALEHNQDLAAARLSIDQARGRMLHSGRFPNPELESEFEPNVRGREFSVGVGFTQKFPLTNRLRIEKAVSQAELTVAEAEVKAAERRLAAEVRTVGVKLLSLQASRELKEKQLATSNELAATAGRVARRGEGSALEATQFELEAQQLALGLLQLDAERASLAGEARPLLGLPATAAVEFTGGLPPANVPRERAPDVAARPDIQAARSKVEAAHRGVALARAGRWEDAGVGIGAAVEREEDAPEGIETEGLIGLRFSLPLPLWNKNEGKVLEAEATAARTELEARALEAAVRAAAAAARAEMEALSRIVGETDSVLLPKARAIEEKASVFHRQAQPGATFADVLRSREKRLALEQAKLDALRAFHLARIRYDAAMGR
jgi:outer membrane protein TolC